MMHDKTYDAAFVGVDWGTSSFRAWLMSASGNILAQSKSSEGMLHCATAGFGPVLIDHLCKLGVAKQLPVLICGMVGARQGWIEAPYLDTPTMLDCLHRNALKVPSEMDVRILPGVAQKNSQNPDVMRGEETQILGAIDRDFSGLVCIPGTHSKWIRVINGVLHSFKTYMTGELFSLLSKNSILMHAVEKNEQIDLNNPAFLEALEKGLSNPGAINTNLFGLRASQLLGFSPRADGLGQLSGLLIGAELGDVLKQNSKDDQIILISTGNLASLYARAMQHAGYQPVMKDAEAASRNGLLRAARSLWNLKEQ